MITSEAAWSEAQSLPASRTLRPPGPGRASRFGGSIRGGAISTPSRRPIKPRTGPIVEPARHDHERSHPPERIDDLWAESRGSSGVLLRWTSPQDNRETGRASFYTVHESLPRSRRRTGLCDDDPRSRRAGAGRRSREPPGRGTRPETTYHFASDPRMPTERLSGFERHPDRDDLRLPHGAREFDREPATRLDPPGLLRVCAPLRSDLCLRLRPQDVGGPLGSPSHGVSRRRRRAARDSSAVSRTRTGIGPSMSGSLSMPGRCRTHPASFMSGSRTSRSIS